jgi:hypothetical protein
MKLWLPGRRHDSWASNSWIASAGAIVVFVTYLVWSAFETAPPGLTTLLGIAGGAWFGALSEDKRRRERDVTSTAHRAERTADRAESKADKLIEVAETQHPGSTEAIA